MVQPGCCCIIVAFLQPSSTLSCEAFGASTKSTKRHCTFYLCQGASATFQLMAKKSGPCFAENWTGCRYWRLNATLCANQSIGDDALSCFQGRQKGDFLQARYLFLAQAMGRFQGFMLARSLAAYWRRCGSPEQAKAQAQLGRCSS